MDGDLFARVKNKGTLDIIRKTGLNQYIGVKGSKVCNFDFYSLASNGQKQFTYKWITLLSFLIDKIGWYT